MPDGTLARNTKYLYSLLDKKKLIYDRLVSLNLPHVTNEILNQVFPEFHANFPLDLLV